MSGCSTIRHIQGFWPVLVPISLPLLREDLIQSTAVGTLNTFLVRGSGKIYHQCCKWRGSRKIFTLVRSTHGFPSAVNGEKKVVYAVVYCVNSPTVGQVHEALSSHSLGLCRPISSPLPYYLSGGWQQDGSCLVFTTLIIFGLNFRTPNSRRVEVGRS